MNETKLWGCATGTDLSCIPSPWSEDPKCGPSLLIDSVNLANQRGVHEAPTVFVNGKKLARSSSLTLKMICDAYTGPKPKGCAQDNKALLSAAALGLTVQDSMLVLGGKRIVQMQTRAGEKCSDERPDTNR